MKPCDSCTDSTSAKEQNRALEIIRAQAKTEAIKDGKGKAICKEEINGFQIVDAGYAIQNGFQIIDIVSHL